MGLERLWESAVRVNVRPLVGGGEGLASCGDFGGGQGIG